MGRVLRLLILGLTVLLPSLAAAQSDSLTSRAGAVADERREQEQAQPVPAVPGTPAPIPSIAAPPTPQEMRPYTPELAGYWDGTLAKGDDVISITVHIEKTDAGYTGSLDSDALQIAGAPLNKIAFDNSRGHWEIANDRVTASFDGTVKGDFLSGDFNGPMGHGEFHFTRSGPHANRVVTQDVTWKNGNVTLSGTLLLPVTPGRHRAVIFLHDAGSEARWVRRYLAQKFAERGIACLIYDKRGVGQSTGNWGTAYFGALADDAIGGVRLLQGLRSVDPHYVGVYGHGQGGALAPLVAERAGDIEFVIATSANALEPEVLELYGLEAAMRLDTLTLKEAAEAHRYASTIVRYAYWRDNFDELKAAMEAYKTRSWYFAPPPFDDPFWTFSYNIQGYRPLYHWDDVHGRVFLAYGRRDNRVPVQESVDGITEAVRGGDDGRHAFRTWFCLECDHDFRIGQQTPGGWPRYTPEFADRLIDFVTYDRRH